MPFLPPKHQQHDQAAQRFVQGWRFASDRLLAGAFIDPAHFVRVVDEMRLTTDHVSTLAHGAIFEFLTEVGRDGIRTDNVDLIVNAVVDFYVVEPDDIRTIAYSYGTSTNMLTFGRWCWEYGTRARLYRQCGRALSDPRPIGEVAQELLQEVVEHVG